MLRSSRSYAILVEIHLQPALRDAVSNHDHAKRSTRSGRPTRNCAIWHEAERYMQPQVIRLRMDQLRRLYVVRQAEGAMTLQQGVKKAVMLRTSSRQ